MASSPPGCCELCGAYLGGRRHALTLTSDGAILRGYLLCVRCRDELVALTLQTLDAAAGALR